MLFWAVRRLRSDRLEKFDSLSEKFADSGGMGTAKSVLPPPKVANGVCSKELIAESLLACSWAIRA